MSIPTYLLIGVPGSGRRELLVDLIEAGLEPGTTVGVHLEASEKASQADEALQGLPGTALLRWTYTDGIILPTPLPEPPAVQFFCLDPKADLIDQLEHLAETMPGRGWELVRVLCVVHADLAGQSDKIGEWYEVCAYFSDVVLLNRRGEASKSWVQRFRQKLTKERYPCLVEVVKDGRVRNPAQILDAEARRLSLAFDPREEFEDVVVEDEDGEPVDAEELDLLPAEPYFERLPNGKRAKQVPQIAAELS